MSSSGRMALALILAAACSEPDFYSFRSQTSPGPKQGLTVVAVWVSDSPVDTAESVLVTFDGVELGGRVLSASCRELDLLALTNGRRELLAEAEVPFGVYDRLVIRLAPSHRVVVDGRSHDMETAEKVVELGGPFLLEGARLDLHADFNARMSVFEAGGNWFLQPAVSLLDEGGMPVTGFALPPGATVSAQQGGREILSTRSGPDGGFHLGPLAPSDYTLVVTAPGHAPMVRRGVAAGDDHAFALAPAVTGTLTGSGPRGVPGLVAHLFREGSLVALAGIDAGTGAFVFPSVPLGAYEVEIRDANVPIDVRDVVVED